MPDITMCTGEGCKLKETCYRYKATPDEFRQVYFAEVPYQNIKTSVLPLGKCNHYWEYNNKSKQK